MTVELFVFYLLAAVTVASICSLGGRLMSLKSWFVVMVVSSSGGHGRRQCKSICCPAPVRRRASRRNSWSPS